MIYRISLNDPKKIVETAIGRQIQAMGFKYNNKHKYWYRKCGHKVMQYLGLARFSGNTYDLCFGSQMLYIPINHLYYNDNRCVAPVDHPCYGSRLMHDMINSGELCKEELDTFIIKRYYDNQIEEIVLHIQYVFDVLFQPIIQRTTDVYSVFDWIRKLDRLRLASITIGSDEYKDTCRYLTNQDELLMLLDMGKYDIARQRFNEDKSRRRDNKSPFEWIVYYLDEKRSNEYYEKLVEFENENRNILLSDGFII